MACTMVGSTGLPEERGDYPTNSGSGSRGCASRRCTRPTRARLHHPGRADLAEAFEALAAAEGRSALVVLESWFHDIPEPFSAAAAPTDIGGHQDADRGPDRPERHRDGTP